jgi:hypothetical protein
MTTLKRSRAAIAVAFAATAALAACGTDSPTEPTVFGTYNAISLNGRAIPFSELDGGTTVTYVSAVLTLKADHTFTVTFNSTETIGAQTTPVSETTAGTFSVSGSTVTFVDAVDSSTAVGALAGNTITVTSEGEVIVFRK